MFKQRKFLIWMSIFLSLFWMHSFRSSASSNDNGGRASTASAVGVEAKLTPPKPSMYDLWGAALHQAELNQSRDKFLHSIYIKRLHSTSAGPAVIYQSSLSVWDTLATCETRNIWNRNSGNGYYGGLQMDMPFWKAYDGLEFAPRPDLATKDQQITIAERARNGYTNKLGQRIGGRGFDPWPTCRHKAGV